MRTTFRLPVLLALALAGLAGCQALDTKYEPATLDAMLKGQVASPAGRFRIPRPAVPVARRNTGIVREGSVFLVIVGPDLKTAVSTYTAEGTEYGVRLMRQPRTYLVLERVWTGGKEIDLFDGVDRLRFDFPDLAGEADIPSEAFTEYSSAQPLVERDLLHFAEFTVRRGDLAPDLAAAAGPGAGVTAQDHGYFLKSGNVEVLVAHLEPTTKLMLDFLILENKPFDGGVSVLQRMEGTEVQAAVDILFLRLGGDLCFRPHGKEIVPSEPPAA
jgi:hypothetical protein